MSNQVPEVTESEQNRIISIISRLMEMGYELEEIVVEVNQQAETGKRYTLDSVHAALRKQNL